MAGGALRNWEKTLLLNLPTFFFVWPENKGSTLIFLMHQHHPCFSVEFSRELPPLTTDSLRAIETKLHACLTMVPFIAEKKKYISSFASFSKASREGCDHPLEPQPSVWDVVVPPGAEKTTQRLPHCEMLGGCEDVCVAKTIQ